MDNFFASRIDDMIFETLVDDEGNAKFNVALELNDIIEFGRMECFNSLFASFVPLNYLLSDLSYKVIGIDPEIQNRIIVEVDCVAEYFGEIEV